MAYYPIVFMQGCAADEPLELLEESGPEAALAYLLQWETGEEEPQEESGFGSCDTLHHMPGYIITTQRGLYIGLTRRG